MTDENNLEADLSYPQMLEWMAVWAATHDFKLELSGEVGFGRPCVGIIKDGSYPDYHWYDSEFAQVDSNGDVWKPQDAYHKHPCVAVLGQGDDALKQLYRWLRWFADNHFVHQSGPQEFDPQIPAVLAIAMGKHRYTRLVREKPVTRFEEHHGHDYDGIRQLDDSEPDGDGQYVAYSDYLDLKKKYDELVNKIKDF